MKRPKRKLETEVQELARSLQEQPPFGEAHQRVLREAMLLIAERGYAGASLRTLASRLRMSQPSLYHYFRSKQELVIQVIQLYAARASHISSDELPPVPTLESGLRLALRRVATNYRDPEHVHFTRFLVAIGVEHPELRETARQLLVEQRVGVLRRFVLLYAELGEIRREDASFVVDLVLNAYTMHFLRGHLLFGDRSTAAEDERFADFVVDVAVRGVRARGREAKKKT